jgi:tripartite-type tricarboxylate transporter receptor subunit TctC
MRKTFFVKTLLAVLLAFSLASQAQDYPSKPIRIVIPTPPGGGSDRVIRLIAEKLRAKWGQTVTVENRPGGGGNIGAEAVARAAPDGHTLLFTPQFTLVINKSLYSKLSFDPDTFVPVSLAVAGDMVLLINSKLPITNVQQLIAFAKANPDRLNYASGGIGSMGHLMAELFKTTTGIKAAHVPYKGSSPSLTDLIGGQVDMMFVALGPALQHIRAGKVRAIAIASDKRNSLLPEVPTVSDTLPDFAFRYWFGMVAPAGTPPAIANKLSVAVAEVLRHPDVTPALQKLNIEVVGSTPAEMDKVMKRDRELWGAVLRASGATAE